jgi:hypothetical protein
MLAELGQLSLHSTVDRPVLLKYLYCSLAGGAQPTRFVPAGVQFESDQASWESYNSNRFAAHQ